ncbi:MAG: hypothetical protein WCE30_01935 [Mycobacterium sp.]
MTTSVDHRELQAYLDVLNARLAAVTSVKARIQALLDKERRESTSVATPFRGTAKFLGAGDIKMLRAVNRYAKETQRIRDSLKSFIDSAGSIDKEHGGKVDKESSNGKVWTI